MFKVGSAKLVNTSPITPPDEKYQMSSKLMSARPQLVNSTMVRPRSRVPQRVKSISSPSSRLRNSTHAANAVIKGNG
ncbi:Uncharacterised protein [Vibrio cholerae]|nr:Uncharacterised protein [Vibrio cholerae]